MKRIEKLDGDVVIAVLSALLETCLAMKAEELAKAAKREAKRRKR